MSRYQWPLRALPRPWDHFFVILRGCRLLPLCSVHLLAVTETEFAKRYSLLANRKCVTGGGIVAQRSTCGS